MVQVPIALPPPNLTSHMKAYSRFPPNISKVRLSPKPYFTEPQRFGRFLIIKAYHPSSPTSQKSQKTLSPILYNLNGSDDFY